MADCTVNLACVQVYILAKLKSIVINAFINSLHFSPCNHRGLSLWIKTEWGMRWKSGWVIGTKYPR